MRTRLHPGRRGLAALLVAAACATARADGAEPAPHRLEPAGMLRMLTAEHVLAGTGLVREGRVYSLAIPTGPDTPAFGRRNVQMLTDSIYVGDRPSAGANRLEGYDDLAIAWLGVGTQIDGFGHVALDGRHFGDVPSSEVIRPDGAVRYGIHTVPPIVTRGVLLDVAASAGVERLADGTEIGPAEVDAALARQGVTLRAGDVVLLHTGWLTVAREDAQRFLEQTPGLTVAAAQRIADAGAVAIGADLWALEPWPTGSAQPDAFLPVHGLLLVERGVHILENVNTAELAADEAWEFLFVLAAPRLQGAVQSPVHPVAIR